VFETGWHCPKARVIWNFRAEGMEKGRTACPEASWLLITQRPAIPADPDWPLCRPTGAPIASDRDRGTAGERRGFNHQTASNFRP
jgi:hypothetical protein